MLHGSETFEINEISFDKYALEEALELPVIHGANKKVRISSKFYVYYLYYIINMLIFVIVVIIIIILIVVIIIVIILLL